MRPVITDLAPSPKLGIIANGPNSFKGRKLGVLVTDGTDASLLSAIEGAVLAAGAMMELIAPKVGAASPSVTAPISRPSRRSTAARRCSTTPWPSCTDAYAHAKFIAYAATAVPLFEKAGLTDMDDGFVALKKPADAKAFIQACGALRFWAREPLMHAV